MPSPLGITAHMHAVREIAQAALDSSHGIQIPFLRASYGSDEAAHAAMRSYQQAFSSLRARARRITLRGTNESRIPLKDSAIRGPFDAIGCHSYQTDVGWVLVFQHEAQLLDALDIIDIATGKSVTSLSFEQREIEAIGIMLQKHVGANPLTPERELWFMQHMPHAEEFFAACHTKPRHYPNGLPSLAPDEADAFRERFDIMNELEEDENPFASGEDYLRENGEE